MRPVMPRWVRPLFLPVFLAVVAACAYPQAVVRTVESRPTLAVTGAPAGAILVVDGHPVGEAAAYDGNPQALKLEPGTHRVEVRAANGAVLYQQRVFLESELKRIEVH